MKTGSVFQTCFVVVMVIMVVVAGADAKKRNRKRPPDSPGKLKDTPRKGSNSPPGEHDTEPGRDTALTTAVPAEDVPQADPAVAPEVETPPSKSKQKEKHRNRGGKRHRDQADMAESSDAVTKDVKDKGNRKKDRSEKKKHHKKHNQETTITTTKTTTTALSMNENSNELPAEPVAESEPTIVEATAEPVAEGDPLVEPEIELDDDIEATMITTTTTTVSSRKHHRDREAKKLMRDQAQTEREARKLRKEQKKREKQEKRKLAKNNPDTADELELTVNPTPSPVADGVNLTPSGPSPLQTTQQQPTQAEPDISRKDKKKNKKERLAEDTELSRTEKRIQRLERKMRKMGHNRKNATRIPCEDHENCQEGQCCLLRRGKKVCHVVNKPEGHHCVHPCMCSQGLTCLGKNQKQKSLSKGHCRRVDITEAVGEGAVADNRAPATVDNELPRRRHPVPNVG